MITKVDVKVNGHTVASFTWSEGKDYYGWDSLRQYVKTIDNTSYTIEVSFNKDGEKWPSET